MNSRGFNADLFGRLWLQPADCLRRNRPILRRQQGVGSSTAVPSLSCQSKAGDARTAARHASASLPLTPEHKVVSSDTGHSCGRYLRGLSHSLYSARPGGPHTSTITTPECRRAEPRLTVIWCQKDHRPIRTLLSRRCRLVSNSQLVSDIFHGQTATKWPRELWSCYRFLFFFPILGQVGGGQYPWELCSR